MGINLYEYNEYDQLIQQNQNVATYDENGNLSNYNNAHFKWTQGKNLSEYTDDNIKVNYTYDSQQNRDSKTINGITTHYYLVNDKVIFEYDNNDNYIYYLYSQDNSLIGLFF